MSGGISFSSEKSWIVATWAFRHTIDNIRNHVSESSFPELYSLVTDDENSLHFIFLEDLSETEKREFISALKSAYKDIVKENGEGFVTYEIYLNYLEGVKELIEMASEESYFRE